jgi:hypothetical protein
MPISVVMSVFNNAPHVAAAVESILGQSFGDFEFIIINDGSTDGSGDILDGYARADRRVRLLHQPNLGLVASLNRAIGEARAPLVARMDGDDIALPTRFAVQKTFLDDHPDHGVVGCQIVLIDVLGHVIGNGELFPTDYAGFLQAMENHPLMSHPGAVIRRDLLVAISGYRSVFRYCEDYDLWLRLSTMTKLCSVPETLLQYRIDNPDQISHRNFLEQQIGAAIAWQAYLERRAGRADPISGVKALPPVESLDRLFGRADVRLAVCNWVAPRISKGPPLSAGGIEFIRNHIRHGGNRAGLWRTCLRLLKMGMPIDALRLSISLLQSAV